MKICPQIVFTAFYRCTNNIPNCPCVLGFYYTVILIKTENFIYRERTIVANDYIYDYT